MNFKILIFVSGIIQILGRPTDVAIKLDAENIECPPWPLEKNMYSLPAEFKANDIINITIHITKKTSEVISIDFMGADNSSTNTSYFSIKADFQYVMVCNGSDVIEKMASTISDGEMVFNMWLQRRQNKQDDGKYNVIQVNTIYYPFKPITVDNIEKIRYLKFSGGNAKMTNLEFKFA